MKLLKSIILLSIISSGALILSCKSIKPNATNLKVPFQVKEAYAKPWVAGVKQGGSGIEYTFELELGEIDNISFGEIWVNNQKLSSKIIRSNKLLQDQGLLVSTDKIKLRCSGERSTTQIIKPPKPSEDNQALISYYVNDNSIKYYLIEKIEIKKSENRQ